MEGLHKKALKMSKFKILVIVSVIFYTTVFIVLALYTPDPENATALNGTDVTTPKLDPTCDSKKDLLGNGYCDDETNNEKCSYDGGDCCLQNKVIVTCTECSCIKTVEMESLSRQFQLKNIKKYVISNEIQIDYDIVYTVKDVISEPVCSILCFKPEVDIDANAWSYVEKVDEENPENNPFQIARAKTCVCLKLNRKSACRNFYGHEVSTPFLEVPQKTIFINHYKFRFEKDCRVKLLVTTGVPKKNGKKSEVIYLGSRNKETCKRDKSHPTEKLGAIGGLLNKDVPVICGGGSVENEDNVGEPSIMDDCNVIGSDPDSKSLKLSKKRQFAASVVLGNNDLFVVGGFGWDANFQTIVTLKDTEYLMMDQGLDEDGNQIEPMKTTGLMVIGVAKHCLLKTNETVLIAIGGTEFLPNSQGVTKSLVAQTQSYDIVSDTWTTLPEIAHLPEGRSDATCGAFKSATGEHLAVVAGGKVLDEDGTVTMTKSTLILHLDKNLQQWNSANLPQATCCGSMVGTPDGDELYFIGGQNGAGEHLPYIYKMRCSSVQSCRWAKQSQELKDGRSYSVAMMIPYYLTNCE